MKKIIFFLTILACAGLSTVNATELKSQQIGISKVTTDYILVPVTYGELPTPVYTTVTVYVMQGYSVVTCYLAVPNPYNSNLEYYLVTLVKDGNYATIKVNNSGQIIP